MSPTASVTELYIENPWKKNKLTAPDTKNKIRVIVNHDFILIVLISFPINQIKKLMLVSMSKLNGKAFWLVLNLVSINQPVVSTNRISINSGMNKRHCLVFLFRMNNAARSVIHSAITVRLKYTTIVLFRAVGGA